MRCFDVRCFRIGAVVAATLVTVLFTDAAHADKPVAIANGGGIAVFTDAESDPSANGTFTEYGLGVRVAEDGSAIGHFNCVIAGFLAFEGDILEAFDVDTDAGTMTVSGVASCTFFGIPGQLLDNFELTLFRGQAGVGGFILCLPDFGFCDTEVVVRGHIFVGAP